MDGGMDGQMDGLMEEIGEIDTKMEDLISCMRLCNPWPQYGIVQYVVDADEILVQCVNDWLYEYIKYK